MMHVLAQATTNNSSGNAVGALAVLVMMVVLFALAIFLIAALWKVFVKAGEPGWAAIVPLYNTYVLVKIAGRPWWWLLLLFIPVVSLIIGIILSVDLAKSFGKGVGFAIGLILVPFIFVPILGFGSAQYQGPAAATN